MKTKHYKIGQLAKLTGLTVDTVRFYENKGLVHASLRSDAGYRLFSSTDLARLQFIIEPKRLDLHSMKSASYWNCAYTPMRTPAKK